MLTPCQCESPGLCPVHERKMPEPFWRLCREQAGYFETFQEDKVRRSGPAPCIHRGAVTGEVTADLCGRKGERFPIYACALHGECVIGAFCRRQKWRSCLTCADQNQSGMNRDR